MGGGGDSYTPPISQLDLETVAQETEKFQDYKRDFQPIESALISATDFTRGESASAAGAAASTNAQKEGALFRGATQSNLATGAQASSGRNKFGLSESAGASGIARGAVTSAASVEGESEALTQKLGLIAHGRNLQSGADQTAGNLSTLANNLSIASAQAQQEKAAARMEAYGAVAGAAARKWGVDSEGNSMFSEDYKGFGK